MTVSAVVSPVEQELRVVVSSATDNGGRPENEDAIFVQELAAFGEGAAALEAGHLAILADGMGGYQRGEVASQMAIETVREMFNADPGADAALLLKQAFRRANDRIYENGQGASPSQMMGTTLIVAVTRGKYATIANIGDSRAYLARANQLTQITRDHSFVADQVAAGAMTESEARESPHRNILTHALGHRAKLDAKMPNIFEITLLPEDRLVLCSDGFHDVVKSDEMLGILTSSVPEATADALVRVANERGTTDNVSAIVFSVSSRREPLVIPEAPERGLPLVAMIAVLVLIAILVAALLLI